MVNNNRPSRYRRRNNLIRFDVNCNFDIFEGKEYVINIVADFKGKISNEDVTKIMQIVRETYRKTDGLEGYKRDDAKFVKNFTDDVNAQLAPLHIKMENPEILFYKFTV
ncbi:MAG: hypothetical protein J6T72_02805 [Alphaproteobacteria bacterium]|nr:hypothetical protein [Alphaproteobacteria bacterium]